MHALYWPCFVSDHYIFISDASILTLHSLAASAPPMLVTMKRMCLSIGAMVRLAHGTKSALSAMLRTCTATELAGALNGGLSDGATGAPGGCRTRSPCRRGRAHEAFLGAAAAALLAAGAQQRDEKQINNNTPR